MHGSETNDLYCLTNMLHNIVQLAIVDRHDRVKMCDEHFFSLVSAVEVVQLVTTLTSSPLASRGHIYIAFRLS